MRAVTIPTLLVGLIAFAAGCHPGPILNTGAEQNVGGTIAGNVRASGGAAALVGRKVTVTNVATGRRFDTTTSVTGGYTIKVPVGTYRLEVELRAGETLAKRPDDTHVNNGDLDPHRDFDITVKPGAR